MQNEQPQQPERVPSPVAHGSATPEPFNEAKYRSKIAHIVGSKKGRVVWRWQFEWKLPDLWIGVFWKRTRDSLLLDALHVWVCLLPCVPLHLWQEWVAEESPNEKLSESAPSGGKKL